MNKILTWAYCDIRLNLGEFLDKLSRQLDRLHDVYTARGAMRHKGYNRDDIEWVAAVVSILWGGLVSMTVVFKWPRDEAPVLILRWMDQNSAPAWAWALIVFFGIFMFWHGIAQILAWLCGPDSQRIHGCAIGIVCHSMLAMLTGLVGSLPFNTFVFVLTAVLNTLMYYRLGQRKSKTVYGLKHHSTD